MHSLARAVTPAEIVAAVLDETAAICRVRALGVYLFEGEQVEIRARGVPDRAISNYLALPSGTDLLADTMRQTGFPVHDRALFSENEWRAQPLYTHAAEPFELAHYLLAPLIGSGTVIGAVTLARARGEPAFEERDLTTAAIVASSASVALARSRSCERSLLAVATRLTARERQVAAFVAKGLSNREIASQLDISDNMVKKHLKTMFANLGVSRRAELAWIATLCGIV